MGQKVRQPSQSTTLYDHIRELQMRLLASVVALTIAGIVVYTYYEPVLKLLSSPLGAPLYYSNPAGSFGFVMKICLTGALIIAIPVLVYNLIMFVRPAFSELLPKKRVYLTTAASTLFAISGAAFAFYCILPGTLNFFEGFQVSGLSALISADDYLGFVTNIIATFVVVFQLPLLITFFDSIKPLNTKKLFNMEKWIILGSLVVALIVPFTYDFVTSLLIALPIILLYNLSIIIIVIRHAYATHKLKITNRATITRPVCTAPSTLSLTKQTYEYISDELTDLSREPISPTTVIKPTYTKHVAMDIQPIAHKPEPVQPAAWVVERKQKRADLMEQARRFTEVNRESCVKRVLV